MIFTVLKKPKETQLNLEKNQQNIEKKVQTNPQPSQDTEETENLDNVSEEE